MMTAIELAQTIVDSCALDLHHKVSVAVAETLLGERELNSLANYIRRLSLSDRACILSFFPQDT